MPSLDLPLVFAPYAVTTRPRTGQRKVGNAPVASAVLTGVSATAASGVVVAWASRAFSLPGSAVVAAATLLAGATTGAGCAAATVGCAAAGAAADFAPGTVIFCPSFNFAFASRPLVFASSATGT